MLLLLLLLLLLFIGYGSADSIVERLQHTMMQSEPELVVLRTERFVISLLWVVYFMGCPCVTCWSNRHQRDQDQRLRQEQEEEFLRSLRADQEKVTIIISYYGNNNN